MDLAKAADAPRDSSGKVNASEEKLMAAELKWLLETRTPPMVSEIENIIKIALDCCTGSADQGFKNWQANPLSTLAVTSSNSDLVKGFLTIDGTAIVKGELALKLPHYNRGNVIKVNVNAAQPPQLAQLRAAQNYLTLALQGFDQYPRAARDREGLDKLLRHVALVVSKAQTSVCRYKKTEGFPMKECDVKSFSPDLPEDLVIDFYVLDSSLMVAVRALNYPQQGIPLQIQSKILGKFRNVKTESYKGRPVEVLDDVTVASASPRLATLVRSLNMIVQLCDDMRSKLRVFKR